MMFARVTKWVVGLMIVAGLSGAVAYFTLTALIRSENTVVVPDLVGRDTVGALQTLSDLGLNTKIRGAEYHDTIPEKHVIFQEPSPGAEIKSGRSVHLIISKGPATVPAPNLKGIPAQQARLILEDNGLCLGNLSRTTHPVTEKDQVIAQSPSAGETLKRNTCLDLLVSTGGRPSAYAMPNMIHRGLDEAIDMIGEIRLELGEVKPVYGEKGPINVIVGQLPEPGQRVETQSVVYLTVNRDPSTEGREKSDAGGFFRHRVGSGFLKKHVQIVLEGNRLAGNLYDGHALPGEEIWVLAPTLDQITVTVFEDEKPVEIRAF